MKFSQEHSHHVPLFRNRDRSFGEQHFIIPKGLHYGFLGSHPIAHIHQIVGKVFERYRLIRAVLLAKDAEDVIGQSEDSTGESFHFLAFGGVRGGSRGIADASKEGEIAGYDSDGGSEFVPDELKQFFVFFQIFKLPFDIEIGLFDFEHCRQCEFSFWYFIDFIDIFEISPDGNDEPESLFFLIAERVQFEEIFVFHVGEGEQLEIVLAHFLPPAAQVQVALAVQKRKIGVLVYLSQLLFLDGSE